MRYIDIKPNDVINGKGIMVSLWVSGCHHHCKGCFQPETWNFNSGKELLDEDVDFILKSLDANNINRNLSILGGDPLTPESIIDVVNLCSYIKHKRPSTIVYVWTGYLFNDLVDKYGENMFKDIDYIIDGKFEEKNKDLTLKLRGSSNQRVIDVKESLRTNHIVIAENLL